jgi:putative oxidoreductase
MSNGDSIKCSVGPTAGLTPLLTSIGLLILRVGTGAMLASLHGWSKLSGFGALRESFPDPIGLGSTASLTLATGAEFFCALLIVLGLFTRLAAIPLVINMAVAAFVVLGGAPWAKKELALLYLVPFVTLLLLGGGRLSLDTLIFKHRGAVPAESESPG